jgi:hypothetical protein
VAAFRVIKVPVGSDGAHVKGIAEHVHMLGHDNVGAQIQCHRWIDRVCKGPLQLGLTATEALHGGGLVLVELW